MKLFKTLLTLIFAIGLLALGIWFSLRNAQEISLDLLFIQLGEQSLALWLIVALALGVFFGWLIFLPKYIKCLTLNKIKQRKINQLEKEVHQLRNQSFANFETSSTKHS